MKTKSFLILLALGSLFSCQQNEQEQNDATIHFSMSIDNNDLDEALTRSGVTNLHAGKNAFSIGDIISMGTSNDDFGSFTIGKDVRTWNEIGTNAKDVKFYAHYPKLSANQTLSTRTLIGERDQGVKEHFFGMTETMNGAKNIALQFKRMTVPVIILNENGTPYNGSAIIKLHVKNRGIQDLIKGIISVDNNASTEEIIIKKLSTGFLTNLIPQIINKDDVFATVTSGKNTQEVRAASTFSMRPGNTFTLRFYEGRLTIVDQDTPLRR